MNTPTDNSASINSGEYHPGDVFQIDPEHDPNFGGAFIVATEIKTWGIQGWCHSLSGATVAYYRVAWGKIVYIGRSAWSFEGEEE